MTHAPLACPSDVNVNFISGQQLASAGHHSSKREKLSEGSVLLLHFGGNSSSLLCWLAQCNGLALMAASLNQPLSAAAMSS